MHTMMANRGRKGTVPYFGLFTPWQRTSSTHLTEGLVGPAAGTDILEKRHISYACQKSNPSLSSQKHNDYTD